MYCFLPTLSPVLMKIVPAVRSKLVEFRFAFYIWSKIKMSFGKSCLKVKVL